MSESEVRALFAVAARPEVVSLAGGMPYVEALPHQDVLDVFSRVLERDGARALQYSGGAGLPEAREAVCELMALEGMTADPAAVVVTVGGQQALDVLARVLLDPGDLVAVEGPTYVGALSAFSAYEPEYVTIPLDDDGMDPEALAGVLSGPRRPKFLYTVPNYSNPAGVMMSYERRQRVVEMCRAAGVLIVEDNPYGMLRFEGEAVPNLYSLDSENVVYIGTVSKVFAPGLRLGWVTAPAGLLRRVLVAKEGADLCTSSFSQLVTAEYLRSDRFRPNLEAFVALYRGRRDVMLEAVEEWLPEGSSWTHPHGGFYVWATLPEGMDTKVLLPEAVEHGVAYVPGTAFYPGDERGRNQMRLSFCYPTEDRIREGVRRLGGVLTARAAV